MNKISKAFMALLFFILFILFINISSSRATTLMIPASTANIDELTNCTVTSNYIADPSSGSCWAYLAIPGLVDETLTSVTFYYYDNSGSQYFYGYVKSQEVDSSSSASTIGSYYDSSTSSSVQSYTITVSSEIMENYSYFVFVKLNYETEFRGIKIEYE